ncbi:MAG: transporter [Sphingobacteriales bacterium]|nr:transporter [Sphingobacteriales bacterium]
MKRNHVKFKLLIAVCLFSTLSVMAQGDGPRSFILLPKGLWAINARWIGLNQNMNATSTILVPKAEVKINVFPITLYHTFSLGGRFAQLSFMFNPGSISASALSVPPVIPLPTNTISANGFSDGFVAFKAGLVGAPALDVMSYMKTPMQFSLFADLRYWYSGTYDASKALNLGTNRGTYHIGFPMAIPLNKNMKKATWLEIAPSVMLFSNNNDPARGTRAKKIEQGALFSFENHISHNFNPKFWAFANLLYRFGGQTTTDGTKNENEQNILGLGAGVGYQFTPFLGAYADYGGIVSGGKTDATSTMWRIAANFTYTNTKKLKAQLIPM